MRLERGDLLVSVIRSARRGHAALVDGRFPRHGEILCECGEISPCRSARKDHMAIVTGEALMAAGFVVKHAPSGVVWSTEP